MAQQTHDPSAVTVSIAGITLTQFAKGTFVEVEYDTDAYSDEVGAGGEVVRVKSSDQRGTVRVTLMAASPSNDELSALAATDRAAGNGVGAVLVKDGPTGTSKHSSENGWIKRIPNRPYSTEADNVQWEFRCAKLKSAVGGTVGT